MTEVQTYTAQIYIGGALTAAQRELLEDKFALWDRASREGNMELRDYNRRAAEALKVALAIVAEAS